MSSVIRKLVPLADRVLIKRIQPMTKTAGGIILPETTQSKANEGEVVAVGPGGRTRDGVALPVLVKIGDKVLLPEYGGIQLKLDTTSEDYFLFRNDEILGKFE